jgi:hypothetical protein
MDSIHLVQGLVPIAGFCESGSQPSGPIEGGEVD